MPEEEVSDLARSAIDILINATDKASAVIKGVNKQVKTMSQRAETAGPLANGALLAMGLGMGFVIKEGVQYNAMLETSEARWTTLLKSSSKAEKQMEWIKKYGKETPFDYKGIDATATSLMGMGMSLEDVHQWLPTIGDGVAVLGGGTETFNNIGRALGQMTAKGKVSAEEMMQLAENGINGWQMIADGMGLTVAEVMDLSKKGELLAKDALPLIQQGMEKAFGGGTQQLMKSTTGQAMQARENFSQLAGALTKGAYDYFGATVLPKINSGLEKLSALFGGGIKQGFIDMYNGSTQAKVGLLALATLITAVLIVAITNLVVALAPIVAAFLPFVAIGALVVGVVMLIARHWSTLAPMFSSAFGVISTLANNFGAMFMASFQRLKSSFGPLWTSLVTLFETLKPALIRTGIAFGVFLALAIAVFNGVVSAIGPIVTAVLNLLDVFINVFYGIVALITGDFSGAMEYFKQAGSSAVEFFKNIWQGLKNFFLGFWDALVAIAWAFGVDLNQIFIDLWNRAKEIFMTAFNAIKQYFSDVKARAIADFNALKSGITNIVSTVGAWLSAKFQGIFGVVKAIVSVGITYIIALWQKLKTGVMNVLYVFLGILVALFGRMFNAIRIVVSTGINFIVSLWRKLKALVMPVVSSLWSWVSSKFSSLMSRIRSVVSSGISFVVSLWNKLKSMVMSVASAIQSAVTSRFNSMMSRVRSLISSGISFIISLWNKLKSMVMSVVSAIQSAVTSRFGSMINRVRSLISSGINFIISLWNKLKSKIISVVGQISSALVSKFGEMMSKAKAKISEGLSNMISAITGYFGKFKSSGKALLESFSDGVKAGIDKAKEAVESGLSWIRDRLPFSPAKKGPLSDLDKSGEAFFPTWAKGAISQASSTARSVGRAMGSIRETVDGSPLGPTLDAFTGGGRVTIVHEVRGRVEVRGDNGDKTVIEQTAKGVEYELFGKEFRQAMRKNKR